MHTATTVDILEMQQFSGERSRAAAHRLTTTMARLETEARQTPGVRGSIDIINSRLQARTSSDEVPSQQSVNTDADLNNSQRATGGRPEAPQAGTTAVVEVSWNTILPSFTEREDTSTTEPYLIGEIKTREQYDADYFMSVNMDLPSSVPWLSHDAGGGFNPDIASWTWYDTIGHPES